MKINKASLPGIINVNQCYSSTFPVHVKIREASTVSLRRGSQVETIKDGKLT